MSRISLDRRAFLEGVAVATAFCAMPVTFAKASQAQAAPKPQMALFLDYPYYDKWGTGAPYVPPKSYGPLAARNGQEGYSRYFSYV